MMTSIVSRVSALAPGWQRLLIGIALLCLLLAGGWLRLIGLNWDQFQHVHPDERFIVWVADSLAWPRDWATGLDPARSTLNPFRWPPGHGDDAGKPRAYAYGHVPLYLLFFVSHAAGAVGEWLGETTLAFPAALQPLHTVGRHLAEYNYMSLVGRVISALCDLGVIVLVFWLGRRAYGRGAGLLAAAAYAAAVLPIQLSHFYAVDMVLTLCVVATVALAVRWAAAGGRLAGIAAGACAGLAVGSKFSAILIILPLVAAAWYLVGRETAAETRRPQNPADRPGVFGRRAARLARSMAGVLIVAAGVFVITNPFAVIEWRAYLSNVLAQNAMVSGAMDAPYTRQYLGTLPYLYFVQQLSQWGLTWPLGLAAWAGLVWAVILFGRGRLGRTETIMLAWALPYFALTGVFHAKFLRYMAPLLPFLLVFGAGGALALRRRLIAAWGTCGALAWGGALVIVVAVGLAWTAAFVNIYQREHPWISASRWIFTTIPQDSRLLTEHWDDALPLTMDEIPGRPTPRSYSRAELPLWDADTPAKLDRLAQELAGGDYLIIASHRLSAPIPRLRQRYPMSSHYYDLLAAGQLGYTLVAEFENSPRLFGIEIRDDRADESFTVYDHPRVRIYRNEERLASDLLRARLGRYLPSGVGAMGNESLVGAGALGRLAAAAETAVWHGTPGAAVDAPVLHGECDHTHTRADGGWRCGAGRPPGRAMFLPPERPLAQPPAPDAPLTLKQPVDTLPVVADFRWNRLASDSPIVAVVWWWLVISALGWSAWPLLFPLLTGLSDRGLGLARTAALLLVGWAHWMAVNQGWWQNRLDAIGGVSGALITAGALAAWVQRRQIAAFWAERRRLLLGVELLAVAAYLAFVGIRLLNPDLWQPWNGGEKFMESAFLNAILRSASFPPYDPYFAGGTLNYYYYGFYLISLLIKLTGIASEVAFNLAVPMLFALTASAIFSTAYSLTRSLAAGGTPDNASATDQAPARPIVHSPAIASGILAVVLALLMGNLDGLDQLVGQIKPLLAGLPAAGFDYWRASRVIPETINEFPFWTFLFADLHAHLMAMPFGMLVVGVVASGVLGAGRRELEAGSWRSEAGREGEPEVPTVETAPPVTLSYPCRCGGMRPGKRLLRCHAERVADSRHDAANDQRSISLGEFPGSGSATDGASQPAASEESRAGEAPASPIGSRIPVALGAGGLLILAVGSLGAINTWDLPTYLLLVAGALLALGWRRGGIGGLLVAGLVSAGIGLMSWLAYAPFYAHYQSQVGGGGPIWARYLGWVRSASPLVPWWTVWGIPMCLALSAAVLLRLRVRARTPGGGAAVVDDLVRADVTSTGLGPQDAASQATGATSCDCEAPCDDEVESAAPADADRAEALPAPPAPRLRRGLIAALVALGVVFGLIALDRPTAALAAIPAFLALPLILRRRATPAEGFVALLIALNCAVVAGTELIYLRDFLQGGDWYRMNTLFKFSVPAWLLLGLACGVMLPALWDERPPMLRSSRLPEWARSLWFAGVAFLVLAGLIFLPLGVKARVTDRFPEARPRFGTLNGMDYMTVGILHWPDGNHPIDLAYDYLAINWLLDHVSGTPVIASAPAGGYLVDGKSITADYYRAGGLAPTSFTGLPTFVGQHQGEQRPWDQVGERFELGKEFFAATDGERTRELMQELRVGYVYVGQLERYLFGSETLSKFDRMAATGVLEVAYQNLRTTIYRAASRR